LLICGASLLNARASSHNKRRSRRSGNAEIHESAARPVGRAKDVLDLESMHRAFRKSIPVFGPMQQEHEFMADLIVVYWRDIPAQIIVKKGRQNAKRELSLRFTEAIDMCAMRAGVGDADAYLAEWRKAEPVAVGDDLEAEAEKALADFEGRYTRERLVALVKAGGKEGNV
jgi:hypothetical protein